MSEQFVVQVVEDATGRITYQSKPTYKQRAEQIEDGLGINLDWEHFTTQIVPIDRGARE